MLIICTNSVAMKLKPPHTNTREKYQEILHELTASSKDALSGANLSLCFLCFNHGVGGTDGICSHIQNTLMCLR